MTLLTYTDDVLLKRMSNDDQEAFSLLYRRYWEDLFITAVKALRGQQEAEDVVQDVFLSIWNRRKELRIEGPLDAYLQVSVRYKAIHYIEKNITRRDYLAMLTDAAVNILPASIEVKLQLKEVQQTIYNTVAQMPPKMQEVYRLSRQQHLTHKEIARQLGISVETVKKHIQHAMQLIKTALGAHSATIHVALLYLLF